MMMFFALAFAGPVEDIRAQWQKDGAQITAGNAAVLSIDWNAKDMSWAAVGMYARTLKAYYIAPGESPYPRQIVRLVATRQNAVRTETHTYQVTPDGKLVFALAESGEHGVFRAWWQGDSLLRFQAGEVATDEPTSEQMAIAASLRKEGEAAAAVAKVLIDSQGPAAIENALSR